MKLKKFIVIFSIALIASLSIPHFSLWNFAGIGTGTAEAAQCSTSATISGRTSTFRWTDPNEKKDPPRNCIDQYNGNPSSATIGAKADTQLIQAGGSITVKGSVAKLCSTCDGWVYTCEAFEEHTCDKTNYYILTDCSFKECPAEFPNRIGQGDDSNPAHWGKIIGVVLIAVAILITAGVIGPGIAPVVASGATAPTATAAEIAAAAAKAAEIAAAAAKWKAIATLSAGAGIVASASGSTTSIDPALVGVTGTAEEFSECPDCYSICGTTYETDPGRAPVCAKGLGDAEVPISFKNATYQCKENYCGMWENKKIKIEIIDPSNTIVITGDTTTDAYGQFSYTFNAPAADGEFTAIVSVPKDW